MLDEKSPLSLYYQLKNIFIDNIKNKIWEVNSKIPTERELCEEYGLSRITVRQALKELENEGYLYRKQGKGTFIKTPKLTQGLKKFYSFSEEIEKMGHKSLTKMIDFSIIKASPLISEKLEIESNEKIFAIKRLRLADDETYAFETSFIVYKYAINLTEEAVTGLGLYNALNKTCGLVVNEAIETFEAVLVNSTEAEILQVSKKSAAIHLERVASANNKKLEFCTSIIRGDKYKYIIKLE
jgi:GntR family transcriptional regulator